MANQYTSVSISGYNSSPPADDGENTDANTIKWATHKTKLADPIKDRTDTMDTNITAAFVKTINTDAGEEGTISGVVGHAASALTVAGGSITPVKNIHSVRGQSSAADDLDVMATGSVPDGTIVVIHAGSDSEVITVKHEATAGAGDLHLAGRADIVLDSTKKHISLRRNGADWYEIGSGADFVDGNTTLTPTTIDPTNDRVPVWDADADEWKNAAPSTLGSWTRIGTSQTAAVDSTIEFTGMDVSGIDLYRITWGGLYTSAGSNIQVRFGDGGGIISSTSYRWADSTHLSDAAAAVDGESGSGSDDAEITVTGALGNVDSEMSSGVMYFTGFGNALHNASCHWIAGGHNASNLGLTMAGAGVVLIAPASGTWDQVQFLLGSGTFTAGEFTLEQFNR